MKVGDVYKTSDNIYVIICEECDGVFECDNIIRIKHIDMKTGKSYNIYGQAMHKDTLKRMYTFDEKATNELIIRDIIE